MGFLEHLEGLEHAQQPGHAHDAVGAAAAVFRQRQHERDGHGGGEVHCEPPAQVVQRDLPPAVHVPLSLEVPVFRVRAKVLKD